MHWSWPKAASALAVAVAVLLPGCGGDDSGSSPTSTTLAGPTVATTKSADELKAALLTSADVPGATLVASPPEDFGLSVCAAANSFAASTDPTEVKSPGLQLTDGAVTRQYTSKARQGFPEQAKEMLAAFSSTCGLEAFRWLVSLDPGPPSFDTSDLTSTATTVAIADGGGLVSITGPLKKGRAAVDINVDLLIFQKGSIVVFVSAYASGGPLVPGQTLDLAGKVAGRLT